MMLVASVDNCCSNTVAEPCCMVVVKLKILRSVMAVSGLGMVTKARTGLSCE